MCRVERRGFPAPSQLALCLQSGLSGGECDRDMGQGPWGELQEEAGRPGRGHFVHRPVDNSVRSNGDVPVKREELSSLTALRSG